MNGICWLQIRHVNGTYEGELLDAKGNVLVSYGSRTGNTFVFGPLKATPLTVNGGIAIELECDKPIIVGELP